MRSPHALLDEVLERKTRLKERETGAHRDGVEERHGDHRHGHAGKGSLARMRHAVLHGLSHLNPIGHSHDSSDSVDDALASNEEGIRTLKISLAALMVTALLQAVVVAFTGSVALLADTIHNFGDALTALPLWVAFALARRPANRVYTYGYGRAEDLAGVAIVGLILFSACVAGYQSVAKLINGSEVSNVGWVAAAGVVGFLGNELVARFRIRVGKKIGSAASWPTASTPAPMGLRRSRWFWALRGWRLVTPFWTRWWDSGSRRRFCSS